MPSTQTRRLHWRRRRSGQQGQSIAEFVIVVPVLLLIFMAIVGFGHTIFANMITVQAANRAARLGAVLYGDSSVSPSEAHYRTREAALAVLNAALRGTDKTVQIRIAGDDLHVTARYRSAVFVPFLRPWLGDVMDVQHESVYRIERDTA